MSSCKYRYTILPPRPFRSSTYNNTIMPRTPTTAANPATAAGLSAPPFGAVAGGVTVFVGGPPAVPFEDVEGLPVPFADGTIPLEILTADPFAVTSAKPELAVTVGADVALNDEEAKDADEVGAGVACAVAEYADTSSSNSSLYSLTMGAISWRTSVASASRKLVMTGWREVGRAATKKGMGAEEAVM